MNIGNQSVVHIAYELYIADPEDDFEIVEVVGEAEPMVFLYGHSGLPEDFEKQLLNLKEGDDFEFELNPQGGFGDYSEDDISEFPLEFFKVEEGKVPEGMLEIGNFVPFTNEDQSQITGRVLGQKGDMVRIDFNHPLAGKKLRFEGEILKVRAATAEEIAHGHVHGEGLNFFR
jgi:FKBP-type peptidyl-prolyl cis-trans isomerase SlyD